MPGTAVINPSHTPGSMSNLQKHGHWMRKHAQSMCLGATSSQDPRKSQRTLLPLWDLLPAWNASPSLLRAHSWHCAPCPCRSRRAGCGSGSSRMQARVPSLCSLVPHPWEGLAGMLHPWEGLAFLWDQSLCSALCSQKENPLNSQLSMGLTAVGHPQAIQRKTTRGNHFKSGSTSMGFKNNSAFVCYR